jgi:hypothetical protein
MNDLILPIYNLINGASIKVYCLDCKPKGGQRGMLVIGGYDHFCQGCGHDFREIAEDMQRALHIGEEQ